MEISHIDLDLQFVDAVRAASRRMVRELGFMRPTLAGTRYSASAVHAIIEIGHQPGTTAAALAISLRLEKSSVSRMLRKLIDGGEIRETVAEDDGRFRSLTLTAHGRRTLRSIEAYGRRQVVDALSPVPHAQRELIRLGLAAYADALDAQRWRTASPTSVRPYSFD